MFAKQNFELCMESEFFLVSDQAFKKLYYFVDESPVIDLF